MRRVRCPRCGGRIIDGKCVWLPADCLTPEEESRKREREAVEFNVARNPQLLDVYVSTYGSRGDRR